jgi:hypothetical protein
MANSYPLSTQSFDLGGQGFLIAQVLNYEDANDIVTVGTNVKEATVFHLDGGVAPSAVVGTPSSDKVQVTLGSTTAGTSGKILLLLWALGADNAAVGVFVGG